MFESCSGHECVSARFWVVLSWVSLEVLRWIYIQARSPNNYLWIEKSIKEDQGPISTVEVSWKNIKTNL